ncbi:hypothetical protein TNCV_499821 [Trichonephila clavipes]|nr:hypothetical protein TNCV_499821 [Trichonephila clavipes]
MVLIRDGRHRGEWMLKQLRYTANTGLQRYYEVWAVLDITLAAYALQITPAASTRSTLANVWKLLGLLYPKNTSKVSLNQCRRRVAAVISNNGGCSCY